MDDLVPGLLAGDRRALSRAISAVENDRPEAAELLKAARSRAGRSQVIGITGSPGVGKSTLLNALISAYRGQGARVGVVAVDPSSPLSGGAILGDRVRLTEHGSDPDVFVRSLAARGHLGGLSRATGQAVDLMDAAGFGVVVVETVGAGQSEVEIMDLAQTVLVICAPGLGDEIQAVKAGILEIAHILVVNKADLPRADVTAAQLEDMVALGERADWSVPVLRTVATRAEGLDELVGTIAAHQAQLAPEARSDAARIRMRRVLAAAAGDRLRSRLAASTDARLEALSNAVLDGALDIDTAAEKAIEIARGDREES